jgi:hypothetical protein
MVRYDDFDARASDIHRELGKGGHLSTRLRGEGCGWD